MPDTAPSKPRQINTTVFFTELILCFVVVGNLLVSWFEWEGMSGWLAVVLMGCLGMYLRAPELSASVKGNVYRSWLLLPLPAWLVYVLDDRHRHPDALWAIGFINAGVLAPGIWIFLASLPLAFDFFRDGKSAPKD